MSDWSDGFDLSDLWTSGQDLAGGADFGGYNPFDPGGPGGGSPDSGGGYNPYDPGGPGGGSPDSGGGRGTSLGNVAGGAAGAARGLFTNPDGSVNWGSLLSILAPLAGGAYAANRTGAANQQMQDSIKQANAQITGLLGGNSALYAPYQAAGAQGLAGLMSQAPSNLASRYKPLGAGNGFSLGNIARGK